MNTAFFKHILQITILIFSVCCVKPSFASNTTLFFNAQQLRIEVEIAQNPQQRQRGLMFREYLAEQHGMLFVYPTPEPLQVWMKNTLLTLDIMFLDSAGRIVSIFEKLPPCQNTPCPIYQSDTPAKFMLEVNGGFIERHQIKLHQQVNLE